MTARLLAILATGFVLNLPAAEGSKLPRVGVLANTVPSRELLDGTSTHPAVRALVDGLRALGWVDGKNIRFVWRSAENDLRKLPALVDELLQERVDVLVGYGPGAYEAVSKTDTVPIVMATSGVAGPLRVDGRLRIESLAKPGGNVTGLSMAYGDQLNGKRLEILKQAAPRIQRVGFLAHGFSDNPFSVATRAAAERLGITLHAFGFGPDASGLEGAFAEMAKQRIDAVVVAELPITNLAATQKIIHGLAERQRMPVLHQVLNGADTGGLLAYGHDINRLYRRAPYYVDRILRGTRPGDLPIEQPSDFELRVNLKAARAIGLELPRSLLVQANGVIE